MSRGLGRIQHECLRVIAGYEAAGKRPTTFNIAAEIYQVEPDQNGNRWINDAQHVATKRALAGLRRKGLVAAHRDVSVTPDGRKTDRTLAAETGLSVSTLRRAREKAGQTYANAERCCLWSIVCTHPAADQRVSPSAS